MDFLNVNTILDAITKLAIFIIAGSIHEFAHAAAAYKLGDHTAKDYGRLTFNPKAHIDPIGSILFPIIGAGIGWMKPVPVFLPNLKNPIKDDAIISFAGPLSNFIQACFAILLIKIIFFLFGSQPSLVYFIQLYAYINIVLMGFNLIPMPPLDGGAILKFILPSNLHPIFDSFSRFGFVFLIILLLSGALKYLLIPFQYIFQFINNMDFLFLLAINVLNVTVVSIFFKEFIINFKKQKLSALTSPSYKDNDIKKSSTTQTNNSQNKEFIKKASHISSIISQKGSLQKDEVKDIQSITPIENANICPPNDFNFKDQVCTNCEWFRNCLIRYANSNLQENKSRK